MHSQPPDADAATSEAVARPRPNAAIFLGGLVLISVSLWAAWWLVSVALIGAAGPNASEVRAATLTQAILAAALLAAFLLGGVAAGIGLLAHGLRGRWPGQRLWAASTVGIALAAATLKSAALLAA